MKAHAAKPTRPRTLVTALRHARRVLHCRVHALLQGPEPILVREFAIVVAEVESGFRHEELIMGTLGYERLREQQEENAVVLSALHRVLPQVEDGDAALPPVGRDPDRRVRRSHAVPPRGRAARPGPF